MRKIYRPEPNGSGSLEIIKWLRQHGDRGSDWDFAGYGWTLSLWFDNDSLEALYILRWE